MKPEDKHFKHSDGVITKVASSQKTGAGKKFGSPAKADIKVSKYGFDKQDTDSKQT